MDFLSDSGLTPEDRVIESEQTRYVESHVNEALENLSEREQEIVRQRIMADDPRTLEELGKQYNISKERVRQIENNVKTKLRKALEGKLDPAAEVVT
jgi:RNA polymerase sigma-32 factor